MNRQQPPQNQQSQNQQQQQQMQYQPPMYAQNPYPPKKKMGAGAITLIVLGSVAVLAVLVIVVATIFSVPFYSDYEEPIIDEKPIIGDNTGINKEDSNNNMSETSEGFSFDGNWPDSITLEYEGGSIILSYVAAPDYNYFLVVNGKTTSLRFMWIGKIENFDTTIILYTGGTDILSTTFYALDFDGNILLEIFNLEDNGMRISDEYPVYEIVNGDTFVFHGSRAYHGASLLTEDGIVWNEGEEFWSSFPDDEVVKATYEMKYLGNGSFGPIERTEITMTVAEYREAHSYA